MYSVYIAQNYRKYSIMWSYLKHYSLTTCMFENSRPGIVISRKQLAMFHKETKEQSKELKRDTQLEKEERYQKMLENLRAESYKPRLMLENIIELIVKHAGKKYAWKKHEVKTEVEVTKVSCVLQAVLPPPLYSAKYRSHFRVFANHEYFLEVIQPLTYISMSYFRLCLQLKVPYQLGVGFDGHMALLKLCSATRPGRSIYNYCDDSPAINELFKVVAQNVNVVDKKDLMTLLHFRYIVKDFSKECYCKLFTMFVHMMSDGRIDASDLFNFLRRLQKCDISKFSKADKKDFDAVIKGIGYGLADASGSKLSLLKQVYALFSSPYGSIVLALNKVLMNNIHKLTICEAFLIHKEIYKRTECAVVAKKLLSKIENKNLKKVTLTEMEQMIPSLIESHYVNQMLVDLFDDVLKSNTTENISTRVLIQMLSYCTLAHFYIDSVLDKACTNYIEDQNSYSPQQLHILLKAIGTLNYIPKEDSNFFTKVELQLMNNFHNINVLLHLEMIVYLIYLDRFPVKLMDHILTDQFIGSISKLKNEKKLQGERCVRIIQRELSSVADLSQLSVLVDQKLDLGKYDTSPYETILPVFTNIVKGNGNVDVKCKPTGSGTYLEIPFNLLAKSLNKEQKYPNDKLAFLVMTEASFCKNKDSTNHMLGEEMANIRLLQEDGLTVVWTGIDKVRDLKKKKSLSAFARQLFLELLTG